MIHSVPVLCEVHLLFIFCIELQSTKKGNNFIKYMALSFQTGYSLTFLRSPFNCKFDFYVCESISLLYYFFKYHIQMISYNICLSPSDLLHLVW